MAGFGEDERKGSQAQLGGMVKLVVRTFLEERHFRQLHRVLADQWSGCHSLTAAVRLMEAHGVKVSPEEEKRLASMPEDRMIDALVMKMPQQSREQFEHFFLQLSFIASTTTRLRTGLEAGNSEVVEESLQCAENVGVLPFLMKMAAAQAGREVGTAEAEHESWLTKTDKQMAPLLQSQATAMGTAKALAQARAQLGMHQADANEKSKKVLIGLAEGNDQMLVSHALVSWAEHVRRVRREAEIRKEYQDQIEDAEKRLQDFTDKQLKNIKGVISRGHEEGIQKLVAVCFTALKNEVDSAKWDRQKLDGVEELENKIKAMAEQQSGNAKSVLLRMNEASAAGLVHMCFSAWIQFAADYKKNREMEDAVKASEQKMKAFQASQKEGAKSVLNRMSQNSESALVQQVFQAWQETFLEDKKANEFAEMMAEKNSKLSGFSSRNKGSAMTASERAAEIQDMGYKILCFGYWKKDVKAELVRRYGKERNQKRTQELQGVKCLFKDFASELDSSLKQGTPRVEVRKERKGA